MIMVFESLPKLTHDEINKWRLAVAKAKQDGSTLLVILPPAVKLTVVDIPNAYLGKVKFYDNKSEHNMEIEIDVSESADTSVKGTDHPENYPLAG